MQISRPCTACGKSNTLAESACAHCDAPLTVTSAPTPATLMGRARLPVAGITKVVAGLVVLGIGAAWWGLSRPDAAPAAEAVDWERPESIEAWAKEGLAKDGLVACMVTARLAEDGTGRRLLEVSCPSDVEPPAMVGALARLLLRARDGGHRTAIQAVLLDMAGRMVLVPVGEAARLSNDLAAAAAWWQPGESSVEEPATAAMPADGEAAAPPPEAPMDAAPAMPEVATPPLDASEPIPLPVQALPASQEPPPEAMPPPPEPPAAPLIPPAPAAATAPAASAPRGSGLRLARAPGRPTSGPLRAGQSAATLLRVQLSTSVRRTLTLESITFRAAGTLQDAEALDAVRLVRESDPTGRMPGQGEPIGSQMPFAADDGTVRFDGLGENFGEDGAAMSIAVIADIVAGARGGSIELVVPDGSGIVVVDSAGEPVRVDGVPLRGARAWVAGAVVKKPTTGEGGVDEEVPLEPERPREP